jgi:hypothetical protein
MKAILKVEYYADHDNMSVEDYMNQVPEEFIVTEDMIADLINSNLDEGYYVNESELYITKL